MLPPSRYRVPLRYSADIYPEQLRTSGKTGKSTWTDWNLMPVERLTVVPPEPKYNFVDIPGASFEMDLTESVTGFVNYGPRVGSWEFVSVDRTRKYYELYTEIMEFLQGKLSRVILRPDMDYYYQGRLAVNEFKSDPNNSRIVLDYHFAPFKYGYNDDLDQLENWVFQELRLDNSQQQGSTISLSAGSTRTMEVDVFAPTIPYFIVTGGPVTLYVTSNNWKGAGQYTLSAGKTQNENIVIMDGPGELIFTVPSGGNAATVEVYYADGHL